MKSKPLYADQSSSHSMLVSGPCSTTHKAVALVLLHKGQQFFISLQIRENYIDCRARNTRM